MCGFGLTRPGHLEELNRKLIMAGGGTELERRKSWRYRTAWDATAKTVKEQNPDLLASHRGVTAAPYVRPPLRTRACLMIAVSTCDHLT